MGARNGCTDLNHWLILPPSKDPDSFKRPGQETIRTLARLYALRVALFAFTFGIPIGLGTGALSLVSGFAPASPALEGDVTLYGALQTMDLLEGALHTDPNPAKGGGDIIIVENSALLPESGLEGASLEEGVSSGQISIYIVREGDSLSEIAEMFNVSPNTILWANDLKSATSIQPGDELVILPISGVRHVVVKGDTLETIAKKYNGDVDEIADYNRLAADERLSIGSEVVVPDGEVRSSVYAPKQSSSGGVAVGGGYFIRPVNGMRTQGIHGYNGVDLAAPAGTPIVAAASGQVIVSRSGGWNGGYGNYVVIKHDNGTQTLYAHNSSNAVGVGAWVAQGDVVGYVGSTGKSTGNHLHFEVRGARNPF